jgi:PAS domain S-box-containing protein
MHLQTTPPANTVTCSIAGASHLFRFVFPPLSFGFAAFGERDVPQLCFRSSCEGSAAPAPPPAPRGRMSTSEPTLTERGRGADRVPVPTLFPHDHAEAELRESRRALATLMDNLPGMAYRCRNDPDWTMELVSQGSFPLTGLAPEELIGSALISYGDLIHPDDRQRVFDEVQAALKATTRFRIVYRIITIDGAEKWVWEQGCGIFSEGGELLAIEGFITDVTEARKAEEHRRQLLLEQTARAAAETAEKRARFVAEAGRVLSNSFDHETALASLARLFVPVVADFCTVEVLTSAGELQRVGLAHVDPEQEARLHETPLLSTTQLPSDHPTSDALFKRLPTFVPDIDRHAAAAVWVEADPGSAFGLHPRSLIAIPLVISDRVVGVLTLGISSSDRSFNLDDMALAEELAQRAALAVENARLFHQAQQATKARDQVLAVVAHDLRNPLNTISVASQLLLRAPFEDRHRSHLKTIRTSTDRMNRLIQDLLEVARIESGHLSIVPRPEAVAPMIEEAMTMLGPLAAGRSILLESECEQDLPQVLCDSARVLQVLSNLIGNAVKFTPPEGRIRIRCVALDGEIRFGVTDSGPGIPAPQLPHVFGRFWQANAADRRGIGLGLSIAKGIVETHEGRIWVESTVDVETTFYFTLPVAAPT